MNQATLEFIRQHAAEDVRQLAFLGKKNPEVDLAYALDQIAGRQKARTKIPSWAAIDGITYPPHLSMEQCSSEQTARYKAQIASKGDRIVDLTAGFGVDMAFMAEGFKEAIHIEKMEQLCAISSVNYEVLGLNHIKVVNGNGVDYLHTLDHADLIFIDPARRDEHGARTYGIADCTPNVLEIIDEMLEKAPRVMIKLSPMLDWQKAAADIGRVSQVHIVSVANECKELLLVVERDSKPLQIFCVNDNQVFSYNSADKIGNFVPLASESQYLYEPNASVMKAGCFQLLSARFNCIKRFVQTIQNKFLTSFSQSFCKPGKLSASNSGKGIILDNFHRHLFRQRRINGCRNQIVRWRQLRPVVSIQNRIVFSVSVAVSNYKIEYRQTNKRNIIR